MRRSPSQSDLFKGSHFEQEIIVLCARWHLRYKLSYRDLVEMMAERGLKIAHTISALKPQLAADLVGAVDLQVRLPDLLDVGAQHIVALERAQRNFGLRCSVVWLNSPTARPASPCRWARHRRHGDTGR
jgi:hypothetical protein